MILKIRKLISLIISICVILAFSSAITAGPVHAAEKVTVATVSNLQLNTYGKDKLKLTWSKSGNYSGARIYKDVNGAWKKYKDVSGKSHITGNLTANTTYKYAVKPYYKKNGKTYWGTFSYYVYGRTERSYKNNSSKVTITNSKELFVGDSMTLKTKMYGSNLFSGKIFWSSSNKSIATISSKGKIAAKKEGTVKITARIHNGKYKTVTVKIYPAYANVIIGDEDTISIEMGKNSSIPVSTTYAKNRDYKLYSTDDSVVKVENKATVYGNNEGSCKLYVKNGKGVTTDTVDVNVYKVIYAKSIALNKTKVNLTIGDTYTLKTTITPENTTDKTVIYSSNNKNVATVSSSGKVTAEAVGKATITAKSSNGLTTMCTVSVTLPIGSDSIALNMESNPIVNSAMTHGGFYSTYTKWYGFGADWCGMYAAYCAYDAGLITKAQATSYGVAYVQNWKNLSKALDNLTYKKNEKNVYPDIGDLILFDYDDNGVANHVGIVVDFDGTTITTREGNTGVDYWTESKVKTRTYTLKTYSKYIMGYCKWK